MNVLFKPNIGGVENSLSEISKVLTNLGYEVHVVCSDKNNHSKDYLASYERDGNLSIYRYNYSNGKFSFFKNVHNSINLLSKLRTHNEYSYIVSRSYFLVIVSSLIRMGNIKYIPPEVSFFSTKDSKMKKSLKVSIVNTFKFSLQFCAFIASKEVFVFSDSMLEQVQKNTFGLVKPIKAEPGINLNKFSIPTYEEKRKLRQIFQIPEDKIVLLCLGRFSEIKQFHLAIESMQYLPENYLLIIVGEGPEKNHYEDIIEFKKLSYKVRVMGSTNSPELIYKLSDAFLMTSRYESFGQTILEASSSGLVIFGFSKASGVNTNTESILSSYPYAYFIDEQTSSSLAKTIINTFNNVDIKKTRDSKVKSLLRTRFSWSSFINKIDIS